MPNLLNEQSKGLIADQILDQLKAANSVLIGTHEHPDGDALGSSLALLHALRLAGKQAVAYIPDPAAEFYSFLPGFDQLTTTKPDPTKFDVLVLLDYTQLNRTNLEAETFLHPRTIAIDHHYDNPQQTKLNLIVPTAAATAHILFALFRRGHIPLTRDMATCLLTGIFTDTGSFMHESTTPEILNIAAALMQTGARLSHIAHETYQKKDLPSLRIWGRALSRLIINERAGVALGIVTNQDLEECQATLDDLSGVVNMLNALPQTNMAMLLIEYEPGKIKGSLRSEPHKGVDVSQWAKRLGGGGHKLASGFEVSGHLVYKDSLWRIVNI